MGRARVFDEQTALDAAMTAFWTHGWSASSTRALSGAMGLSTSSLYASFGSKADLFERVLERYAQRVGLGAPGADAVMAYVRRVASARRPRGCLLVAGALELDELPERPRAAVERGLGELEQWLSDGVGDAAIGRDLFTVVLGLQVKHRAGWPAEALIAEAEGWLQHFAVA